MQSNFSLKKLDSQITSKQEMTYKLAPTHNFSKMHQRTRTTQIAQNPKRTIASIYAKVMSANKDNAIPEEEVKSNTTRLHLPKPINIDLGNERLKSILPTEKLRENFDLYSYLDDKNKLKNLKAKIKILKHQAVHTFQTE